MAAAKSPARHTRSAVPKASGMPHARADAWILSARVTISAVTVASAAAWTGHASHGIPPAGQCRDTTHAEIPSMAVNERAVRSQRFHDMARKIQQPAPPLAIGRGQLSFEGLPVQMPAPPFLPSRGES